eukprot:GFUD01015015.1.p1 GENE.GFUD01015015.1~~GFUD01015015.1.p1  ORF type:complete len:449 (-),score=99.83 GFUD01015015.1:99-1445(-)
MILLLPIPLLLCLLLSTPGLSQGEQEERFCSDYSDCGYHCVPYYQCDRQNKIITDGAGLIGPRTVSNFENICKTAPRHELAITSRCSRLLEVCCLHPTLGGGTKNRTETPRIRDRIIPGPRVPRSEPTCGKRNERGVTALPSTSGLKPAVGESEFGEWPHVCIVLQKQYVGEQEQLVKVYQCGASLIAEGVVLTAAHCVNNTEYLRDKLIVRCGEWDSQSEQEDLPFQEQEVDRIEKHPCFTVGNHHNNYALLFLKSKFRTTSHISPVCLPRPGEDFGEQNCVSNGWGKDKFGVEGSYSTILKEIVIPLVDNSACQQLLRDNTRLGPWFELHDSFICAGGQAGIDTCKGDGGSPLTCRQSAGPWYQAGIVSWGIGCGENNIPAVYANVAAASCWIDNMVTCHYDQTQSFFGFSTVDCPDSTRCSQTFTDCSTNVNKNEDDIEDDIFNL